MSDLKTQLTVYLDETAPRVEFEEIIGKLESPDDPILVVAAPRRSRGWLVAVAAFVGVLVLVGGLAILLDIGGGSKPATSTTVVVPTTGSPQSSTPESGLIPALPGSVVYSASFSTGGDEVNIEADVWYLDSSTWRIQYVELDPDISEDGNTQTVVKNEDAIFIHSAWTNTFDVFDLSDPFYGEMDPVTGGVGGYDRVQLRLFECDEDGSCIETCIEDGTCVGEIDPWACAATTGEAIAGLETTIHECERLLVSADGSTQEQSLSLWLAEDGTNMKWEEATVQPPETGEGTTVTSFEITRIEYPTGFDAQLFAFECPTENCTEGIAGPPDPLAHSMAGQPIPELEGFLLTGESFALSELVGTKMIVNLSATWCPPCEDQLPHLQTLQNERPDIAIVIVLPSDEPNVAQQVLNQHNITLLAVDPIEENNTVISQWQTSSYPTTYLVDETGTVVAAVIGFQDPSQLNHQINDLNW